MNISRSALLAFCLVFAVAVTATAAESKWKLPNLNPFSKKNSDHSARRAPPKTHGGLKLPKIDLWPNQKQATGGRSPKPSTWAKLTTGTKNLFNKTKQTLASPWKESSSKTSRFTKSSNGNQFGRTEKRSEKKSIFASWFPKEEEPRKPAPHEFLRQPMPLP